MSPITPASAARHPARWRRTTALLLTLAASPLGAQLQLPAVPVPLHSEALQSLKIKALSASGALNAEAVQTQVTDAPGSQGTDLQLSCCCQSSQRL